MTEAFERVEAVAPTPVQVALKGLCPRCGAPGLFKGLIDFAPACRACQLDFSGFNVGDGPAALLTLVLGAIIVGVAVTLQLTIDPPIWLQILIWIPITAAGVMGALRMTKAALIALEYRNAAREGRVSGK